MFWPDPYFSISGVAPASNAVSAVKIVLIDGKCMRLRVCWIARRRRCGARGAGDHCRVSLRVCVGIRGLGSIFPGPGPVSLKVTARTHKEVGIKSFVQANPRVYL
jgi:hypothetical protein